MNRIINLHPKLLQKDKKRLVRIGGMVEQIPEEYTEYVARVLSDGGAVADETLTSGYIKFLKSKLLYNNSVALLIASGGSKKRLSAGYNYATKLYDASKHNVSLGSELVVNGGFDDASGWIFGSGFSVSGGKCVVNSEYAYLSQDILSSGNIYQVEYTITDYTSGTMRLFLGSTELTPRAAIGTYTEIGMATSGARNTLDFISTTRFVGKIDNVSVKQLLINDAYQFAEAYQPAFQINNESFIVNAQKEAKYIKHNPVTYNHNTAWTVVLALEWNGGIDVNIGVIGNRVGGALNTIFLRQGNNNVLRFINKTAFDSTCVFTQSTGFLIGKLAILHIYATESGKLGYYVNGYKIEEKTIPNTGFIFSTLLDGNGSEGHFSGRKKIYRLQSGAISETDALAEANYILSKNEKIKTVSLSGNNVSILNADLMCSRKDITIPDGTVTGSWTGGTPFWCYHTGSSGIWGKLYNKAGRDVIVAYPPIGYHVATEAELTAMSLLGGTAIKTALSLSTLTASRNADGTFNTWGETASIWCADSDKVLLLDTTDSATIVAATANQGHSIRLIKNAESTLQVMIIGDSTSAAFSGQNDTGHYLLTSSEKLNGAVNYNISVQGDTIAMQKARYLKAIDKELCNFAIVQIGINDLFAASSAETIISALQDLVNTVNMNKKAGSKVIISTLTPCREALTAVLGAYENWLAVNTAIMTTITGVDGRVNSHTTALSDGSDNLAAAYQLSTPDNLHENNAGRLIIATAWRDVIDSLV